MGPGGVASHPPIAAGRFDHKFDGRRERRALHGNVAGYFGAGDTLVYNAPPPLNAVEAPAGSAAPWAYDEEFVARRVVACAKPRVIDLAPTRNIRALPIVIYGSPPPCAPRDAARARSNDKNNQN